MKPLLVLLTTFLFFECECIAQKSVSRFAANQLYQFLETTDDSYCNPDLISPGDCNFGNFYFSKSGKVIYYFFCIGADSVSYLVGGYTILQNGINCLFTNEYSFLNKENKEEKDNSVKSPNLGRMKKIKPIEFKLNKIGCEKFEFYFRWNSEKYVLKKSSEAESSFFYSDFKTIKLFKDF